MSRLLTGGTQERYMKRTTGKITALILSLAIAIGIFASCELVEVNTDKDMNQAVASVQVDGAAKEDIYKREIINGYVSYGYYYVMNYGYTQDAAYELILNNLINNKVVVQYARLQLDAKNKKGNGSKFASYLEMPATAYTEMGRIRKAYVESLLPFVTDVQVASAAYSAKSNINSLLDSFEEKDDTTEEKENESITARTTPTVKTADGTAVDKDYAASLNLKEGITEEELTDDEKTEYEAWQINKYTSYPMEVTQTSRKAAARQAVELFTEYGIIGADECDAINKKDPEAKYNFRNYVYYLDLVASSLESSIISNYEDFLTESAEASITDEALWDEYESVYRTQKASYGRDYSAYEEALEGATEDSYILYNPEVSGSGYGYVANILIGFSDAASSALSTYKASATTQAAIDAYREQLCNTLIAKDLRTTWLQNGYYKKDDAGYSFDSDYVKTETFKKFFGNFEDNTDYGKTTTEFTYHLDDTGAWVWADADKDDYTVSFKDIVPAEYSFKQFLTFFKNQFGASETPIGEIGTIDDSFIDAENKILTKAALDCIDDFLFAFGTDTGSLNNYLGYLYSPKTSSGKYVPEFADAAKELVESGVGSYSAVITDYGIHLMICTKVVTAGDVYADYDTFKNDITNKDSVAYRFKKAKISANVDKLVDDVVTYNISKFIDEEDSANYAVTKYEKAYKNLIPAKEESSK